MKSYWYRKNPHVMNEDIWVHESNGEWYLIFIKSYLSGNWQKVNWGYGDCLSEANRRWMKPITEEDIFVLTL